MNSLKFDLPSLFLFLEKGWFEKTGLVTALVSFCIIAGGLLATGEASRSVVVMTLAIGCAIIFGLWRLSLRLPKTQKNKIGFVVSISCPDDDESRKVREDFVVPLRQLVKSGKVGVAIQFIEFPKHLAQQINDPGDAEKLRVKSRSHFMLHGRVRLRVLGGKQHHIIELDGIVSHKPISDGARKLLQQDFSRFLPRRIIISTENDVVSFQFTSEWTNIVARYIIGWAAAHSGAYDYAEELYKDASDRLGTCEHAFPIYSELASRLPIRISEIYETKAGIAHKAWCETHEQKHIDALGNFLENIVEQRKRESGFLFLSAVHVFLKDRDIDSANRFLKKIKDKSSGVWNYNVAFLRCYVGDLISAIRHYRNAAKTIVEADIITQVESFMCWVLDQEPDKYQISYCLGFFNWKTKGDTIQATKDFNDFLNAGRVDEFVKERELAREWLDQINPPEKEQI